MPWGIPKSKEDNCFHPMHNMSKKTYENEWKYSSYELEVLIVIEALKKFLMYVLGSHFKIVTDSDAFVKMLNKKEINSRVTRWALQLKEFNYEIERPNG